MATLISTAQILGITGAAFASGMIASVSVCAVPGLALGPPDIVAKQWRHIYHIGANTMPPMAIACATCFAYLAYTSRNSVTPAASQLPAPWILYSAAAVTIPMIAPYTLTIMEPGINGRLKGIASAVDKGEEVIMSRQDMSDLLQKWNSHSYVRAALVATGAFLGAVATFAA